MPPKFLADFIGGQRGNPFGPPQPQPLVSPNPFDQVQPATGQLSFRDPLQALGWPIATFRAMVLDVRL